MITWNPISSGIFFFPGRTFYIFSSVWCTHDLGEVSVKGEVWAVLQGLHQNTGDAVDVLRAVGKEHEGEGDHNAAWRQMSD